VSRVLAVDDAAHALDDRARGPARIARGRVSAAASRSRASTSGTRRRTSRTRDVAGRTLVHRTSAGTQGLARTAGSELVLAASFVTAGATARACAPRASTT
jgi:2-phosphosulfolactate phosphatase